jgi:CDP-diacylglycerol--serine O-phosphatidyltransferase
MTDCPWQGKAFERLPIPARRRDTPNIFNATVLLETPLMESDKPRHKGFYILPNLMTTASLFSGFLGMLWAIEGSFQIAAVAVLVSCLFDGLDGKVARLTNTASEFGIQLDSLADLVSFGVAPALLVYLWETHTFGRLGILSSFLFLTCGALRLARFNVSATTGAKKFFIGLPIPAAACTVATLILFTPYLPDSFASSAVPSFALGLVYVVSLLMVSNVRYATFKDGAMVRSHRFSATVTSILIFVLVASEPKLIGFLFFISYVISGLVYTFVLLPLRRSARLRESSKLS